MILTRNLAVGLFLGVICVSVPARAQSLICYASPAGNDLNDGSNWASAKADVMACYDAMPPAGGTIYLMAGRKGEGVTACRPGDPPGCGIWIMGRTDPNYSSPPPGWRKAKGAVSFIGVGGPDWNYYQYQGLVHVVAGSPGDKNHPGIWLSGVQSPHYFENLSIKYPGRGIVIGENSNQVRTFAGGGGTTRASFENVSVNISMAASGTGPGVDLTGGSFWLRFSRCVFSSNPHAVSPGDDTGAAVLLDGKSGGGASADFEDVAVGGGRPNGGGSIKFYPTPVTVSNLYVHGLQTEALQGVPAVWIAGSSYQSLIDISDVTLSDSVGNAPAVEVDGTNSPPDNVLVHGLQIGTVVGPATILGSTSGLGGTTKSPQRQNQRGIFSGILSAQVDVNRRSFSPSLARFTNLASQLPSHWYASNGSTPTVTAVAAPDGTTNAGELSGTSPPSTTGFYQNRSYQPGVGDWIVAGVWVRGAAGNGYHYGNNPAEVSFQYATLSGPSPMTGGPDRNQTGVLLSPWKGDGEWEWVWGAWKVETSPKAGSLFFTGYADRNGSQPRTTDFFAPVLMDIPAGSVSDNEAVGIAANLSSYRDDAVPGQVSLLRGEQFKADSIQVGDGPTITSGLGPPQGSASPGSIYLCRDGAPGSTFYIYEKDGWKAQF